MSFLLFLAAASIIALSPGPGIFYVAARTLADGRGVGLASSLGTGLGGLVHVAAHGRFRADNPMFSALEMADGPLMVHDLEQLRRAPHRIVLSACDSGIMVPVGAGELLGLASAVDTSNIRSIVFGPPYSYDTCNHPRGCVVIPNIDLIRDAVADAFSSDPANQERREHTLTRDNPPLVSR